MFAHPTSRPSQNHVIAIRNFATRTTPASGRRATPNAPLPSERLVTFAAKSRSSAVMSPERAAAMNVVSSSRCAVVFAGVRGTA
ncbi:hypothetical protein SAMN04489832_0696 [Micromonospora cremea]|uniref:Uncharacterized protein n=1 Tax=Micromonospora cremea TaxID=709881 RepID=A0A1N5U969_9ACTN|nr:hypothetical protein SAMN04489832_0696 [Micromonospora cremea]